jgi:hypothetical protein
MSDRREEEGIFMWASFYNVTGSFGGSLVAGCLRQCEEVGEERAVRVSCSYGGGRYRGAKPPTAIEFFVEFADISDGAHSAWFICKEREKREGGG